MSTYTQQEELDKLKAWWKNYGNSLVAGVLLGLVLLVGYRYWNDYREQQRVAASALYEELLAHVRGKKSEAANEVGRRLRQEHAATPYAGQAALLLARQALDVGDSAAARSQLQWAMNQAADPAVAHVARLRLARLLTNEGRHEPALALLEAKDMGGYASEYLEAKGDLLLALHRREEARAAYREALKALPAGSAYQAALQMKLDDLGAEKAP